MGSLATGTNQSIIPQLKIESAFEHQADGSGRLGLLYL
jgi:hypothetical protein